MRASRKLGLFRIAPQAYHLYMSHNTTPYDPTSLERLAQIIDRARMDNGTLSDVSRTELYADLEAIHQIFPEADELPEQQDITQWDMIQEEHPLPTRRYKIFSKALAAADPLTALRKLSRDRAPSELYLLRIRIKSRARSKLPSVEKDLPDLNSAEWSGLSLVQQLTIRLHIRRLEKHYRRKQSRVPNPTELLINEAIHELERIFTTHTHFDSTDTDLPYSAKSWFVQFVCLALAPFDIEDKLKPNAISARWGRINGSRK